MKIWYAIGVVVIALLLWIAYYAISPLFINVKMDEPLPVAQETAPAPGAGAGVETEPVVLIDTPSHPASGTVRVVSDGATHYLRYENFKTINGPDIYVYLAKDIGAKEFVNLGKVKATEGNVNYEIPEGVDPRDYPYALVWCKAFGVLFNSAQLY